MNEDALTEQLAASQARYRALYDGTPSMLFTVADDHTVASVNCFALERLGYEAHELVGHPLKGVFVAEDREGLTQQLARCFANPGQVFKWEARKVRKDGGVITVKECARAGPGEGGRLAALIACEDVTEQKAAEQALLQAQKLETLGVLVGSIAHDFNNLLGTIVGNTELALLRLPPESPAKEPMQLAARASLRAAEVVKQLLIYSARAPVIRERVDLNALVREMAEMLSLTATRRVRVELELDEATPAVVADPTQLRQVLMNLVHNAADAMEGRDGAVRVKTSGVTLEQVPGALLGAGSYACLEVLDRGVGMTTETLGRIFDPFFTTRATGRGLGLAAVRGIVHRHGGSVQVDSVVDEGSRFRVLLPAAAVASAPAEAGDAGPLPELPRGAVVLIVDDEPSVLHTLAELVREFALSPLLADGVARARDLFSAHPELRCVLLDLTMPNGGGAPLAREFHARRPEVPVLLMSGFAAADVVESLRGVLAGFLAKPFTPLQLKAALAKVLQA